MDVLVGLNNPEIFKKEKQSEFRQLKTKKHNKKNSGQFKASRLSDHE